ncbi:MAG TPA: translocation/assembly module TamB domain-containing protein [Vicinamibacterales bacterium]|nr:translocation/assembly module TamB domain-containing protein [Vicinamibacterales bacterium]
MASTLQHRSGILGVRGPALRALHRLSRYVAIAVLSLVVLLGAGVAVTQTSWFKNWLRQKAVSQAAQYLNGELTIARLGGDVFTGVELEGVALRHEGQTAVAMDKLIVTYSPWTMISEGLILDAMTLENPTLLLQRDQTGWNFNRFVKTRRNTGGRGAPPITMESIVVTNGHVILKDRDRVVEDLTTLNARFRFAYEKPGVAVSIGEMSAHAVETNLRKLAGELRFDRGSIVARDLAIETDRSNLLTTINYAPSDGSSDSTQPRLLDVRLDARRLSLPEIGRYFHPLATIALEPAVTLHARGPLDELKMDVSVTSSAGAARGPLVGHFGSGAKSLEGRLAVRDVDMAPMLNRVEWKTRVTGQADFTWVFSPTRINFKFAGPHVEGLNYQAADVRAQGVYELPRLTDGRSGQGVLRFDASGAAYGADVSTRATFHFATPGRPLSYTLAGNFQNLDLRRLPDRLAIPKLETHAAGQYQFEAAGRDWRGSADLDDSIVEGARFGKGTLLGIQSRNSELSYSASGHVASLNPRRFAGPLAVKWLDEGRLSGSLTGTFTFEGSGRTTDSLVMSTNASLLDSTLAGARFPSAAVDFQMASREIRTKFVGRFEDLPGTLFTDRKELADTTLNGSADMGVGLAMPKAGPIELLEANGTTTLTGSTVAGMAVDSAEVNAAFANRIADIKQLIVTGPDVKATALGTLAMGDAGTSNLEYDVAVTNLDPLAKRANRPLAGSAHVVGRATGPASNLTLAGTLGANRLRYGTNVEALTANSKYTVTLPDFDVEQARIEADTAATFVTISGRNLPRVTAQTTYEKNELKFSTMFEEERRSLGFGGNAVFHPDHNELHLRALNLTVGKTQWSLPAGQETTARYSEDSVAIENFVLRRGPQQITAAGTVAIGSGSANLANDLNVRLDNVQVEDINELLLGNRALAGVINATAEIRGTRNDPVLQSSFALTGGSVEGVKFNSLSGKANYSGRAVDLDARLEQTPQAVLTAVGTAPIPNGPGTTTRTSDFDLNVKSTPIDIALFQPATTQLINLTGQAQANVHVGGTLEAPRLNGLVETSNGGFSVVATGVTYTDAIVRLMFENDRLLVDRFEVSDDGQDRLVAIGELGIVRRSVGEMNVQVSADQFKILDNELGNLQIQADLRLTGDVAKPAVTGEILAEGGRLEVDRLLEQLGRSPYRTEAMVATEAEAMVVESGSPLSLYDAATVDIRLELPDDLVLRGRDMHASFSRIGLGDMNITVGGDLRIRKSPAGQPDVIGTVSVVRGFYDFQGRRFEVLRDSQIRFQGARPVDPALQVDAQRVISGVTAVVNIRGTARQPQVRLSSTPPLDEADVLSLIVFNQPINQLGGGERLNLAERAGGLAVGYLASPLASSIADALDLDIFEIRASGGANGQPSIALGQQIGSRLFVSFRQEFGSAELSQLSLEYRVNELLRLVSTVTEGSQRSHRLQRVDTTGVDLIYTISY